MGDLRGGRWHADPTERWELRYWDGRRWTEHVQRRGFPGVDPIADPHASYPTGSPVQGLQQPSGGERGRRRIARRFNALPALAKVAMTAILVATLAWPVLAGGSGDRLRTVSADGPRTTAPPTSTAPPTTLPPSTTTASTTTSSTTTTEPPPTTAAPPPTTTTTTTPPPTTAPPATTAPPPPPTTAEQPPACDPNYSGCVPVASDVDCSRDEDGPAYADGPVWVIGEDIYHLDRNGDGVGCGRR